MMELYIETLTGTAFELRVSPYETVQDVKARIQHLEGIPISQQHLVWQSVELQDDFCLRDYSITDGATLKLVLTMRGGPINTRRFPVEDQALHEMAEYLSEAGYLVDDGGATNRPVTVIVYHNGDQISFYRIVDPDSTSPLSETISAAYLYEDEEDDEGEGAPAEKVIDDDKTREKMKLLRMKMENMTVGKKPKKKLAPRPPSSHRPNSRLRRFTTSAGRVSLLNRNPCLPPVAHGSPSVDDDETAPRVSISSPPRVPAAMMAQHVVVDGGGMHVSKDVAEQCVDCPAASPLPARRLDSIDRAPFKLSGVRSPASGEPISPSSAEAKARSPPAAAEMLESLWQRAPAAHLPRKWDPAGYTDTQLSLLRSLNSRLPPATGIGGSGSAMMTGSITTKPAEQSATDISGGRPVSLSTSTSTTSTKTPSSELSYNTLKKNATAPALANLPSSSATAKLCGGRNAKKPSVILESLDASEVQAMSGMLTSIVQSANKSRANAAFVLERSAAGISGRLSSNDSRLTSSHLQKLPTTRDGRIVSPSHHLPPVKQKKKPSKRCFLCTKKTGLATSYLCRCGNNYCALHRYAESHDCTFDYKTEGRKILEQSNPVITAPKLPKI